MHRIKTWRDPYNEGWATCYPREIELNPGLTVLVGCNGAGKTTLLRNIQSELKKEKIPVCMFDNLNDGGSHGISSATFNEDWSMMATMWSSSEGETINLNIGRWMQGVKNFILKGRYNAGRREDRLSEAFRRFDNDTQKEYDQELKNLENNTERWLLMDAADSGLSIDNVIEYKDLFKLIEKDANSLCKELYIVISANEYELAKGEQCFDVNTGKYLTFKDYDDYRNFILETRRRKDKRYSK